MQQYNSAAVHMQDVRWFEGMELQFRFTHWNAHVMNVRACLNFSSTRRQAKQSFRSSKF